MCIRDRLLIEQRDQLNERINLLQQTLERLNRKIDGYEQIILPVEQQLRRSRQENGGE